MLDVCGPLPEGGGAPKTPAGLIHFFEELCREHGGTGGEPGAATAGWPPLWAVPAGRPPVPK